MGVIGLVDRVIQPVDQTGQFQIELCNALGCDRAPIRKHDRLIDWIFPLDGDGPFAVRSVGFANINHEELRNVAVGILQAIQGANLAPEGRSGVAAEHQNNWFVAAEGSKLDRPTSVRRLQRKIRRIRTQRGRLITGNGPRSHLVHSLARHSPPGSFRRCTARQGSDDKHTPNTPNPSSHHFFSVW